jgi:hypothetical protein
MPASVAINRFAEREPAGVAHDRPSEEAASLRTPSPGPPAALAVQQLAGAQPTIRVTIGRVELRAVMPQQPTRPAVAPSPKVSLDDYLRSRNRGA